MPCVDELQNSTMNSNNSGGIPLTTWINSALNSINNTSPQGQPPQSPQIQPSNKINSTSYSLAALNIAQSLICQLNLSYTIGDGTQQELILPNDISNWSNSINVIHLINTEGEHKGEETIVNISRAEFTIVKENEQRKCLSRDENKHIYSLVRIPFLCVLCVLSFHTL